MILANCLCLIGIVWSIRNRSKIFGDDFTGQTFSFILVMIVTIVTIVGNGTIPYKEVGLVLSEPEAKVTQLEHNGVKYEGVGALYPVKEFGPPVRPAEYKKQYKNFYGAVIE